MIRASSLVALGASLAFLTPELHAQAGQDTPEFRVVTISSFKLPLGQERGKVMDYMRKWMVEPARLNPNVLSYRILQHFYGSNAEDVAIIAEYPSWEAVTADCEPCQEWFQQNMPDEGTPEREEVDAALALFLKYYSSHSDQVYSANMSMAKP